MCRGHCTVPGIGVFFKAALPGPTTGFSVGSDTLTVGYSGDNTYASAPGTSSVTVLKINPSVALQAHPQVEEW